LDLLLLLLLTVLARDAFCRASKAATSTLLPSSTKREASSHVSASGPKPAQCTRYSRDDRLPRAARSESITHISSAGSTGV
jgi:hypothetical protein